MIVLDTNVVSEPTKQQPNPTVRDWFNAQAPETLFLTSVTVAELLFGLAIMPQGKRREQLQQSTDMILHAFSGRMLVFDVEAGRRYAELALAVRKSGLGFPMPDAYIAAIAKANNMSVATRDTVPFAAAGLKVINPWKT
jgi:predicted nucleic acid-binding protein